MAEDRTDTRLSILLKEAFSSHLGVAHAAQLELDRRFPVPAGTLSDDAAAWQAHARALSEHLASIGHALGLPLLVMHDGKLDGVQDAVDAIHKEITSLKDAVANFVEISEDDAMHYMNLQLDDTGNSAARRRVNETLTAHAQPAIARQRQRQADELARCTRSD